MKICTNPECARAGEPQPSENFSKQRMGQDGLRAQCRGCNSDANRRYREQQRERLQEYRRERYRANGEAERARDRVWRQNNPDYHRAWEEANPRPRDQRRDAYLRRNYGITLADESRMYDEQHGVCPACQEPLARDQVRVDHCHTTKLVRGLIHHSCNVGIGHLGDTADGLRKRLAYLEAFEASPEYRAALETES